MVDRVALRFGVVACVAALALAGCGRKGPLELPPSAPQTQTPSAAEAQQARVIPPESDAGLIQPPTNGVDRPVGEKLQLAKQKPVHSINGPQQTPPAKPFVLDPLL